MTTEPVWIKNAIRRPSPNCDERPAGMPVDLLVLHNISLPPGEFGGNWIDDFFLNRLDPSCHPYFAEICEQKVSAHLLIKRDGELVQFVPLNQRAWHAGVSEFQGRPKCNDFSIGIELEGADDLPFDERQYQALIDIIKEIRKLFPEIKTENIVGHSDIAPDRKTDPGPHFDWSRLKQSLRQREQDEKTS